MLFMKYFDLLHWWMHPKFMAPDHIIPSVQVFLKNLPPNSLLIEEIVDRVKAFLMSKALLKGDSSTTSRSLNYNRRERVIAPIHVCLCFLLFLVRF